MALYLDGQKIISGGSGSGGHTIVDNEGVSLDQRTNLQFKGAYSEDNSTDDTTEVNVVREMTKAEYDELTEEEKTGLINITDITGGNDDRFQPVIYSEDEREIGVWVDGKPLYQTTLIIDGSSLTGGQSNVIQHGIANVDYIQLLNGTYTFADGETKMPLPFSDNYKPITNSVVVIEAISSTTIRLGIGINYQGAVSPNTAWITVQYTKTTDTAGSGQWTPQGVPAHHYSTDEQVVGTWIDGSTLYERTISFTTPNDSTYTQQPVGLLTADIDKIWVVDGFTYKGDISASVMPYAYTNTIGNEQFEGFIYRGSTNITFDYKVGNQLYEAPAYVTIRYTKTST